MPALSRVDRLLAEAKSKFVMKWHKKGGMYYVALVKKEAMAVVRILGLKEDERAAYTTFVNSEPKTSLDYIKVVYEGYGPAILNEIYDAFTFSDTARLSIERAVAQSNYTMVMRQEEKKKLKPIAVRSGAFHKWLGKSEHDPITAKDIELGLASKDGNIRRMAKAAQAKRNMEKKK